MAGTPGAPRVLDRLRGMFALALWDRRTRQLVLARDRVGKKPLYYAPTAGGLAVRFRDQGAARPGRASRGAPNLTAIDNYLSLQYVPAPETAFAGHSTGYRRRITWSSLDAGGMAAAWSWCDTGGCRSRAPRRCRVRAPNLQRELVDQLEEAVRLRMIADVPLGAFLSGGIDSSSSWR